MGIKINHLTKRFGSKTALNDFTLTIDNGMFGLLGPNGAGKTTLMRMLCTLLEPSGGSAVLNGVPLGQKREIRRMIGYLPQDFSFYPHFSVYETLDYLGLLSGMKDTRTRSRRIGEMLEITNLSDSRKAKVKHLSGGMRRRLGIAQVLLHDPGIVIVDEPTAGLDPEERIRFRNLLASFSGGKTVLFSTHISEDILQTCPNVAVLNEGRLLYAGGIRELTQRALGKVWQVRADTKQMAALKAGHGIIAAVPQDGGYDVRLLSDQAPLQDAVPVAPSLEDAYMLLVKGGKHDAADMV